MSFRILLCFDIDLDRFISSSFYRSNDCSYIDVDNVVLHWQYQYNNAVSFNNKQAVKPAKDNQLPGSGLVVCPPQTETRKQTLLRGWGRAYWCLAPPLRSPLWLPLETNPRQLIITSSLSPSMHLESQPWILITSYGNPGWDGQSLGGLQTCAPPHTR